MHLERNTDLIGNSPGHSWNECLKLTKHECSFYSANERKLVVTVPTAVTVVPVVATAMAVMLMLSTVVTMVLVVRS